MGKNIKSEAQSMAKMLDELCADRKGKIIVLDTVDSTNTYLRSLSLEGKASFKDCVIANEQSAGRGRMGRSFASARGKGIYLSYLFDSSGLCPCELMQITARVAVAVRDAIFEVAGIKLSVKWVNDLVYDGKKLCGILTETAVSGNDRHTVVGIGVNVNHSGEDFPEELSGIAASLKMISGREFDREKLCSEILKHLDKLCDGFSQNKSYYLDQYRKSCITLGKKVRIIRDNTEENAVAHEIDENFALVAIKENGESEIINSGEVSVKGLYGYV